MILECRQMYKHSEYLIQAYACNSIFEHHRA